MNKLLRFLPICLLFVVLSVVTVLPTIAQSEDDTDDCIADGVPGMMLAGIKGRVGIEGDMPQPLTDMIAVMMCDLEVPSDLSAEIDMLVADEIVSAEQVAQIEEMMGGGMPGGNPGSDMPPAGMIEDSVAAFPVSDLTPADIPEPDAALFPREVDVEGQTVIIDAMPERIVVMSTDVGDILLQLVPPEHFAAIPERLVEGVMANYPLLAGEVEQTLSNENQWDPEVILSYNPDLIVVHVRMPGETDALAVLAELGVPVVAFRSSLETPEEIADTIRTLGKVTGADEHADELADDFLTRIAAVEAIVEDVDETDRPVVLVLNTPGGMPMMVGTSTVTDGLIRVAGARSAAEAIGIISMTMFDTEQIIAANPDRILLIDFVGAGREPFAPILESPGMASLPAMQEPDNILMLPVRYVLLSSNSAAEGVERIATWLYPDLFEQATDE
jgi:iron complex transport system substrate-binding protein